jgi:hypothetical protein
VVLALLGLSGVRPDYTLPVATIAAGIAFLLEGAAVMMRFSKLLRETSKNRIERAEFGTGLSSEFLGGITGTVLGILALLSYHPLVLVPVSALAYGLTLMLSSGLTARLNSLELEGMEESTRFKRIAHEALSATTGLEFALGVGVIVLGIIALSGTAPMVLSLVAMLAVGISGFLAGAAVTTRMLSISKAS